MATTLPVSLTEMITEVAYRTHSGTATLVTDQITRHLNAGIHDFFMNYDWPWMERRATLKTHAEYTTGTVAIALAARTTVTGTDTLWNTAVEGMGFNNARIGGKMVFNGESQVYAVSAVGSDTAITLVDRWVGSTALSGASYKYFEDEYALESDFLRLTDVRSFSSAMNIPIVGRRDFYKRFPRNSQTGRPVVASIIELTPTYSSGTLFQPRVVLAPAPDAVYNIPYRYQSSNVVMKADGTFLKHLTNTTDEPVIPLRYRMAIVHYAVYSWYRDRADDARAQVAYGEYQTIVQRAQADFRVEQDKLNLRRVRPPRMRGYGRGSNFSTGTNFDELRDW